MSLTSFGAMAEARVGAGHFVLLCLRAGRAERLEHRSESGRNVAAGRELASHRLLLLSASSNVVSIQRWYRVTVGGDIDHPPSLGDRLCGADRVVRPWALRVGEGPSGLDEPPLRFPAGRHSCWLVTARFGASWGAGQNVATRGFRGVVRVAHDPIRACRCGQCFWRGA